MPSWLFLNFLQLVRRVKKDLKKIPSVLCHLFCLFSVKEPAKLSSLGPYLCRQWMLAFTAKVRLSVGIYPVLSEGGMLEMALFAFTEGGDKAEILSLKCGSDTQKRESFSSISIRTVKADQ